MENWLYKKITREINEERARQDKKWGGPKHDDQHSAEDWCDYIISYATWAKQMAVFHSDEKYRKRMIQVAALAHAAIESLDRTIAGIDKSEVY